MAGIKPEPTIFCNPAWLPVVGGIEAPIHTQSFQPTICPAYMMCQDNAGLILASCHEMTSMPDTACMPKPKEK